LIDSHINDVAKDVSSSLRQCLSQYVSTSPHKVSANLAARFLALKEFCTEDIVAPANFGWAFAISTVVVWDRVAMDHKVEMGMQPEETDWHVHVAVNNDLESLLKAALGPPTVENRNRGRACKV
jgi:hypothetical protein